jgi:transposase-like protein
MMVERDLLVDHVTIWRWVQYYAPILNQRVRREDLLQTPVGRSGSVRR